MSLPKLKAIAKHPLSFVAMLDEFDTPKLSQDGIYPLTENNKNIVETSYACNRAYKNDIYKLANDLRTKYGNVALLGVLKEINKSNSTRVSDHELNIICDLIMNRYATFRDLFIELKNGRAGVERLFRLVADAITMPPTKSGQIRKRYNPSFASKFIFYMSEVLSGTAHSSFSKYDSIVAARLPAFLNEYGINDSNYSQKDFVRKQRKDINALCDMYFDRYNPSVNALKDEAAKAHKYNPSLGEVDHIIWYL